MLFILLTYFKSWNIFTSIITILLSPLLSNAQGDAQYLDLGGGTGTFKSALTKGFHPGGSIIINGTVHLNPHRFVINLEDVTDSKIYLHINPRFDEKLIVFSHKLNNDWRPGYGMATVNLTGLSPAANFEFTILCNSTGYMIDINKKPCYFFKHRFDTSSIRNIKFKGDITINSILYAPGNATCQMEGCQGNEECIFDDGQFQCKCTDGYSGPSCQVSCKVNGCTGNNVCVVSNEKYACRSRTDLLGQFSSSIMCRQPYVAVDTECAWVVMSRSNWDAARIQCQENGGFLMEPNFPVNFKQYMSNNFPENDNTGFWMGGSDRGLQRMIWVTSLTDVQEDFPWGHGEPNDLEFSGTKEDCMSLYTHSGRSYFYNDQHCTIEIFYICEAHPLIAPTAAALVVENVSTDQSSFYRILQLQVAILLLLIIAMVSAAGIIIYKNIYGIKKAYNSLGSHTISFSNHNAGKLNEEDN